jgi:hypothetical protein
VTKENLDDGLVYPPLNDIREVSTRIAIDLAKFVYKAGLASTYPEPENKEEFVRSQQFSTDYESFLPDLYDWPPPGIKCTYEDGNVVCRKVSRI